MHDVIIIGAGPAGIMAALQQLPSNILIIEKGQPTERRKNLINGWFGQGLYSKFDYSLLDFLSVKKTKQFNFDVSNKLFEMLKSFVIFDSEVINIEYNKKFIISTNKKKFTSKKCIIATGKNAFGFNEKVCQYFELKPHYNNVSIGIRVEIQSDCLSELDVNKLTDLKQNSFVGEWEESDIVSSLGFFLPKKSNCSNFMVDFTLPFNEALRYIKIVNVLNNDKIKKELAFDFVKGKTVLKHFKEFRDLKEKMFELESLLSKAVVYIPELKPLGILPKHSVSDLFFVGECRADIFNLDQAIISAKGEEI
jgi:hypothetical protein